MLSAFVVTALALMIRPLRGWGVAGLGLLLLAYPYLTTGLLLSAAAIYYFFLKEKL